MLKEKLIYLKRNGFFNFIPDKAFYDITYRIHCKKKGIDWKNPKTYSEKLNWLKLYDRRELYHTFADKYEVRDYVRNKVGDAILIPLYGVYNSFGDIDFKGLPEKFVIKCTHDSGSVRIVEKSKTDFAELEKFLTDKMKVDFFHYSGREWPYKGLKARLIVEEFLKTEEAIGLVNYKFHCFNGEPKFVVAEMGFNEEHSIRLDHYDLDFNILPFYRPEHKHLGDAVKKPNNLDEMIRVARILSENIPYLRVDLYEIGNQIYFSELTLYPGAGFVWFEPEEWNYTIGDMIDISTI